MEITLRLTTLQWFDVIDRLGDEGHPVIANDLARRLRFMLPAKEDALIAPGGRFATTRYGRIMNCVQDLFPEAHQRYIQSLQAIVSADRSR